MLQWREIVLLSRLMNVPSCISTIVPSCHIWLLQICFQIICFCSLSSLKSIFFDLGCTMKPKTPKELDLISLHSIWCGLDFVANVFQESYATANVQRHKKEAFSLTLKMWLLEVLCFSWVCAMFKVKYLNIAYEYLEIVYYSCFIWSGCCSKLFLVFISLIT